MSLRRVSAKQGQDQNRAHRWQGVPHPSRCQSRRVRLHRTLLQQPATPLEDRLRQPTTVRTADAISLRWCLPNWQQSTSLRWRAPSSQFSPGPKFDGQVRYGVDRVCGYPMHRAPRLGRPLAWMGTPAAAHSVLPARPTDERPDVIKRQGSVGGYIFQSIIFRASFAWNDCGRLDLSNAQINWLLSCGAISISFPKQSANPIRKVRQVRWRPLLPGL